MQKLVALLIGVKILISIYDVVRCSPREQHDYYWHSARTVEAGLVTGKMEYDPPLYYVQVWPVEHLLHVPKTNPIPLMRQIQVANLAYLVLFYLVTIYGIFPRLVPDERHWALASILLLALPGYQKLAVMVHCDNVFAAFCAATLAYWLAMRRREAHPRFKSVVVLAILAGLTGLTRPLAIGPVFLFWVLAVRGSAIASRDGLGRLSVRRFLARAAIVTSIVGVMSGSWYVYRWAHSGDVLNAYKSDYIAPFQKYKKDFPWKHYFTTFYFDDLLRHPSRSLYDLDKHAKGGRNKYANSFFTILYSDFWGDQWLYFTGHRGKGESRFTDKRRLFVVALPLTLLFVVGLLRGVGSAIARALASRSFFSPKIVVTALAVGGFATYMWWQTGPALLPGKNSTIKFIYIAFLIPSFIALAASRRLPRKVVTALTAYALVVFAFALPVSIWRSTAEAKHASPDEPTADEEQAARPPPAVKKPPAKHRKR